MAETEIIRRRPNPVPVFACETEGEPALLPWTVDLTYRRGSAASPPKRPPSGPTRHTNFPITLSDLHYDGVSPLRHKSYLSLFTASPSRTLIANFGPL